MSVDRRRLEELFHRAAELHGDARRAFLAEACAGDDALRRELESLLASDARTGELRVQPFVARPAPVAEADPEQVGPYRIVRRLGEGGFGIVYEAEQVVPLKRRVALKLVKAGMDTHALLARFEAERQTLALMDHPGIARVLDAGATDRGRPYFVMELVDGVPITQYCDDRRLPVPERLALFAAVGHAVQHAHQKGVIHRDLKPSNILVGEADGRALPKVIDFGIAKATGDAHVAGSTLTQHGMLVGTPEYMSPEQLLEGSSAADTRSDVYALGVVLHQLLTGQLPRTAGDAPTPRPVSRVTGVTADVPRPSARVATASAEMRAAAERRGTDTRSLARTLRGDLDWIVLRALEAERERRYATVNALVADLQRYLADEPVSAGPPSAAYRLGKFARRNKVALAVAGAVLFGLLGGLGGITWSLVQSNRARVRTETALHEAETARDQAQAVTDFLQEMLSAAGENGESHDVLVSQVLEKAAPALGAGFQKNPAVLVTLQSAIARAWRGLGQYARADSLFRAAESLGVARLGPDARETISARGGRVVALRDAMQNAAAESINVVNLESARRRWGPDDPLTLQSQSMQAVFLQYRGEYAKAESLMRRVLATRERTLGAHDANVVDLQSTFSNFLAERGRLREAESLLVVALPVSRDVSGSQHSSTLSILNNLGLVYLEQGRDSLAEPLMRECLGVREAVLGPEHPDTQASRFNLAVILSNIGRYAEAEVLFRRCVDSWAREFGPESPRTLVGKNQLARAYWRWGRLREAEALQREVATVRTRVLGPDHPSTLGSLHHLANMLRDLGRFADAEALYARVYAAQRAKQGDASANTQGTAFEFGRLWMREGRPERARPLLAVAARGAAASVDEDPRAAVRYGTTYGECLLTLHEPARAESVLAAARDMALKAFAPGDSLTVQATAALARVRTTAAR